MLFDARQEDATLTVGSDTERLARLLAGKTGKSPEDVIHQSVEDSARTAGLIVDKIDVAARLAMFDAARAIAVRSARRPVLDHRSEDEILGYDKDGIPG